MTHGDGAKVDPRSSRGAGTARWRRLVAPVALLVAASLVCGRRLASQSPAVVSLTIVPDSLALRPGRPAEAVVVLRNASAETLRDVRLSWFTNSRLEMRGDQPGDTPGRSLEPGATAIERLTITGREQSERSGSVIVRADFVRGSPPVRDVAFAPITVRPVALESPDEMLDVQVSASLATLTERQPGHLYLLLKNKSDVSIIVDSLVVKTPDFLVASHPGTVTVGPRSIAVLPVDLEAKDAVRPGKHQVVLDLPVRWTDGRDPPRHLALAREVEVGVVGESVILQALGVPSFLVLPGCLMVLTFGALWKRRVLRPDTAPTEFPIELKNPEFWLLAITLSGVMAVAYPAITGGRDYLDSYGIRDVATVWMISVFVIGVGAYVVVAALERWWLWRRTPNEGDDATTILEKLGRQGLSLLRPRVEVGPAKSQAFALEAKPSAGPIWVGPAIRWQWTGGAAPEEVERRRTLEQLTAARAPGPLAAAVREGVRRGSLRCYFEALGGGSIGRPRKVELADVTWSGADDAIADKA